MGIHPLVLTRGVTRDQIEQTLENAAATIAIGNGPTMVLILGFAGDQLVEASGVIRDEDVLFVYAAPARESYQPLLELAQSLPGAGEVGPPAGRSAEYGWSVDGLELSDSLIEQIIKNAVTGHDVDVLKVRLRTGRPAPLAVGDVVRLELEPKLHTAATMAADEQGMPVHELIRVALRAQLSDRPVPLI